MRERRWLRFFKKNTEETLYVMIYREGLFPKESVAFRGINSLAFFLFPQVKIKLCSI